MTKPINKYPLFLLLLTALFCTFLSTTASAKIYVDIDSPSFTQFPIAVRDFHIKNPAAVPPDTPAILSDHIRRYLDLSGFFNLLDKKSFLDGVEVESPEIIRFSDWSIIGADFLLTGEIMINPEGVLVESRLYDVTRGNLLFSKKINDKTGDWASIARSVATDILLALTGSPGDFQTQIAYIVKKDGLSDIQTLNYEGTNPVNLTSHQSIVVAPRWSPDGRYLAFTSYRSGRPEVYLRSMKTGKERKIAAFPGLNLCGSFSPDSEKLLLTLSKDGNEEIYAIDIDTLALTRLTHNFSIDVSPAWSPDGKKIVFVSNRSGSPQIFTMDAGGDNVKRITYEGNYNTSPSWSPRGGRIAYEGMINHRYQIFSVDEEGNNLIQLTFDDADNESPSWSPSGRQIVFSSRQGSESRIIIVNANGLHARILKKSKEQLVMPAWSPRLETK